MDFLFFKFGTEVYLGGLLINLCFVWSYFIEYAHNDLIIDFTSFGVHSAIIPDRIVTFTSSEAACKFSNRLFFVVRVKLISHQDHTVKCRYNPVQFITIWHTALRWQQQNVKQSSNSQQTPHTSPSRASYGESFMRILKKIDRVIAAPHCIQATGLDA